MKIIYAILTLSLLSFSVLAQGTKSIQLSDDEEKGIFTDDVKEKFEIDYPIFRAYKYNDKKGDHIILFTEKIGQPNKTMPLNKAIKAFIFDYDNGSLSLDKTISDVKSDKANTASVEKSIWFWTKYLNLSDLDQDGLADPIVVYGTAGINKYDDGRIKILVYYKGDKIGIHHQNSTLDFERNTKVDASFYSLPAAIQSKVKSLMNTMISKEHAIFPAGWKDAMDKESTSFDEN